MRQCSILFCLAFFVAACGSGSGDASYVEGQSCETDQRDTFACGVSAGGAVVSLQCKLSGVQMAWVVQQTCKGECKNGECVAADTSLFDDVSQDAKLDTVQDQTQPLDFVDASSSCQAGQTVCLGVSLLGTCREDGSGYDSSICPELTACESGNCYPIICEPGENEGTCLGPTSYRICNPTGTNWVEQFCSVPNKCYNGDCVDLGCPPDAVTCAGMTGVQKCIVGDDGKYAWVVTETCDGGICKEGKCLSFCEVNLKENSYLGCDYWAVDLDNIEGGKAENVAVVVSVPADSAKAATITFTDMSKTPPVDLTAADLGASSMEVQPGQLTVFKLPAGTDIDDSIQTNKSFRVRSSAPVTVHQFNPLNGESVYTNDASLLLPANVGAMEYIGVAWPERSDGEYTLRGFLTVVATQEGVTTVQVSPTTKTLEGINVPSMEAHPAQPYVFNLAQGDVLNIEADGGQGADLTGTIIKADKKISVFGGHECANVPIGVNYCDHLEMQLYPVQVWGTHYIGDAFRPRNAYQQDTWRILSAQDGVQVTLNPAVAGPFTLSKGEWTEFQAAASFEVTATGPILLAHYMQGSNYTNYTPFCTSDTGTTTGIGDPSFTLAVPMVQYLSDYIILTPPGYLENYLSIIFEAGTETSVTIDGKPLPQYLSPDFPATPAGTGGWAVAHVLVQEGVHTVSSPKLIGVSAYGYDCDVSYAYPGGLSLKTQQE